MSTETDTGRDNPYRAPEAAEHDALVDAHIEEVVALHDRHPLLARAVDDNFLLYARRWHLDEGEDAWPRPWHWPAFLFGFHWLMYRRMYLVAFAVLVANFSLGAAMTLFEFEMAGVLLSLGIQLALGISGNALYRWHCRRLVARSLRRFAGQPGEIDAELDRRGGTSKLALGLGLMLFVVIRILEGA